MKIKLSESEGFSQLYEKIVQLKIESSDGKKYLTDTAHTEIVFRINIASKSTFRRLTGYTYMKKLEVYLMQTNCLFYLKG